MRVSSCAAVRSNAGYVARSFVPSSAGSGMLQCTRRGWSGKSGQTSLTLSHSVIDAVETLRGELVEVLGAVRTDVDAALLHDSYRVPMQRLRVAPGARGFDRSQRKVLEERGGDLGACTVSRAEEQHARSAARPSRRHRQTRLESQPGMERGTRGEQLVLTTKEIERVIAVTAVGRAATASTSPPSRSRRRWYETKLCGSSTNWVSSHTARSLSASAWSSCQRTGCATSRTNSGSSAGTSRDTTADFTRVSLPAGRQSNQMRLMYYLWWPSAQRAGSMFWLSRKRFSGS